MIPGAPREACWIRSAPRRSLPAPDLDRLLRHALGNCKVVEVQPLTAGFRNANFKVQLETGAGCIVVRIYEHDASLCQKEIDLLRMVGGSVPVPRVIHAEPEGLHGLPPFLLMEYVEGISFHDLKRSGDMTAIAQAAFSAGETLAAIGRITFPNSGWLAPGPAVAAPLLEGADPTPRFVDLCLASTNLQRRMTQELRDRSSTLVWSRAPQLAELDSQASLVHGDFGKRNLLVRCDGGQWSVAAVLDWEFAFSGSPLADLGHFLRYERASHPFIEPYFSEGYLHAGGILPQEWRQLARLVDLAALCESLTHDQLPDAVVSELTELIRTTVEDRDPLPA
ncbi:MAG: phosphotransferase [Candidatus Korobacteraceae bacterium]|jgi:aminoglycoside phosphotransferase (APT) family kinase protein